MTVNTNGTQGWYQRDSTQYNLNAPAPKVDAWYINDEINGVQQTGIYIHAKTKKRTFGVSISKDTLVEWLLNVLQREEQDRVEEQERAVRSINVVNTTTQCCHDEDEPNQYGS